MANSLEVQSPNYPPNYAMTNPSASPLGGDQDDDSDGVNLLAIAWRSRWLILLCTLLGGLGAWSYLERAVPRYTSKARIYVQRSVPRLLSNSPAMGGFGGKYLYTQAQLVLATPVLAAVVEAPENASLETIRNASNPIAVLRKNMTAKVGRLDDIINVSIELPNATDAAQIVNSVVDEYITKYADRQRTDVVKVLTILRNEKKRRDDELEQRRQTRDKYRDDHIALAMQTNEDNVVTQLFLALSSELNATQIELLEAKTRYGRAKRMLENPDQLPFLMEMAQSGHSVSRGADLGNQIQQVEQNLIALRAKWGEGYPAVKLLQDSLDELRGRRDEQKGGMVSAYVDTLRQNYELLAQRRDELQHAYDKQFHLATQVSSQAAKLASLQEAYARAEKTCDILDERIKEVNLTEEVGAMNVSIFEVAAPGYLSFPERRKTLALGLAFGSMLGFGLAWLRDFLDHRLRSIDEIASVLQLPVIGSVPLMPNLRGLEQGRNEGGRVVALQPRSVTAEAIRTLRTALHFGVAGPDSKVFVVTSPAPGDGKSTVASNLAIAMAEADQRVLLIDADMRKSILSKIFGREADLGFASVLSGDQMAADLIVPTGIESLDLLPCGKRPSNPVELLNTGVFSETINQLLMKYDRIVIDSPPVMAVADVRLIAAQADCTILVLRAERSTRRLSVAARDELLKVRAQRMGIVVNAVPARRSGYSYGSGYGYGAYEQAYGEEEVTQQPSQKRRAVG